MTYQIARQIYQRECIHREQAFYYPFIEYLSTRTENAIRKSLGEDLLAAPEGFSQPENLKKMICWPGVGSVVLQNLADGLDQAGYESFDPKK
ncbi:hypothetical protein HNR65_001771 [Desulfosalsimonas propionicica]|uniref:Uncharacterized protein n=1 Tax=Desulfosalsimonas propionicica TaxID=332175 RepID=A0A7W0C942_9BACT|nr:hypothetical protein [Desulfosalsimonas propionicica]MBA2881444.1 hypothetical protein [Desulfosalsimonas propionicica]